MKQLLLRCCRAWLPLVLQSLQRGYQGWCWLCLAVRIPLPVSCIVLGPVELHGTQRVAIGDRGFLYPGLYLETQHDATIEIGDGVVISRGVHIVAHSAIRIGAGSMLGEYCSVRDANHRRVRGLPIRESGFNAAAIEIGREVWIGRGAVILAGVSIGDGATIAANAVVSKNVAAGTVVGGVPAKLLSSNRIQEAHS
ncbi:acyltransferase [uncultured Deefgea sp.]|uniref:acyltransferase n=1 Tax=uncultured Deefgea sp. TaxID=1304914 RepID=UPI002633DB24|nr:acyltransferase [uncultured Deefgea sp.]